MDRKSEPQSLKLTNVSSELFMLILHLRATEDFGDEARLRQKIKELIDSWRRKCQRAEIETQDVETAQFALIAFLDETIITSDWAEQNTWMASPLQMEYYSRFDAGEEFFTRLEDLRQRPKSHTSVLEIYYLCMAMGFEGKYQLHDKEKLRWVIEDTYNELREVLSISVGKLSPHGRPRDEIVEAVKTDIPLWVIGVVSAGFCIFVYVILNFIINGKADNLINLINQHI